MKINIIGISLAILGLALPIAAQANSDCGIPQGYGTTNPHPFNASTCGLGDNSYHVPNTAKDAKFRKPAGYGTTNPYIPNSGAPHLGSNTDGP